ncbi:hypothetical protein TELCIR_08254 [Teladorsagia circumcincta]|uniref:SCP domain-containing protein n=1 Tax=Teladorsagia circumcincta TaxID=45464 RepID=A0A2G9UJJ3_TELCI|nr:hypothetical protein TELCIR_08254 [Teladorsagia circumcincta]
MVAYGGLEEEIRFMHKKCSIRREKRCEAYLKLAWQWSSKIGCAIQDCSTFTYAGCEYNPSGNILGSMIYEIGEPCKVDADCKCTGCTCSVDEALCVQPFATTKKPTSDNTLTQDPIPVPVNYKAKWPAKPGAKVFIKGTYLNDQF